ncbi:MULTISPECIES: HYC_CC_PP family protein [Olivibacter]|uniref:Uncharacterized protein n=3 Tax=Sphingobacteriaceae TaxID=84566 RepID=F4C3G6_SPHS2|nr:MULTISPECIES: hypothetical protein [Olivibacter]MDM8174598.1 hypothetical protein [Olivibacter sp. 47]MDX3913646.1 hypothetical protein [Pseudosphingobacterium sp.]QEL01402.1 hypothetical protein FKG96_11455 [Olivibacter sp. LS-1]
MKKLFAFILTFVYLGIATGFSTYSHYCMDRYVETSLWKKDMSKCGVCGMNKSKQASEKNCCKEEHKQVKLEKKHQASQVVYKQFKLFQAIVPAPAYDVSMHKPVINVITGHPVSHAPPNKAYTRLYRLNCTYLI